LFLFVIRSLLHALCMGQACSCTVRRKCLSILVLRVFGLNLCIRFHCPYTCYVFFYLLFLFLITLIVSGEYKYECSNWAVSSFGTDTVAPQEHLCPVGRTYCVIHRGPQ
jgi:hypothetical protein